MHTSKIPESPSNASPSHGNESNSTSDLSGLTPSELHLILLWRKAARSGSGSPAMVELLQWVFTDWAMSLRQNIYDLQTILTLFGQNSTRPSRDRVKSEITLLTQAISYVAETWADIEYEARLSDVGRDPSPDDIQF